MRPFGSADGLIEADALAQRYHCRPSALLGETDPYRAYCLDAAAALAARLFAAKHTPPDPPPSMRQFDGHAPLLTGVIGRMDD